MNNRITVTSSLEYLQHNMNKENGPFIVKPSQRSYFKTVTANSGIPVPTKFRISQKLKTSKRAHFFRDTENFCKFPHNVLDRPSALQSLRCQNCKRCILTEIKSARLAPQKQVGFERSHPPDFEVPKVDARIDFRPNHRHGGFVSSKMFTPGTILNSRNRFMVPPGPGEEIREIANLVGTGISESWILTVAHISWLKMSRELTKLMANRY